MDAAESTTTAPAIAGRYRVERQIGEGGGGRVFRAWDETLQRLVAIKQSLREAGAPPKRNADILGVSRPDFPKMTAALFDRHP